MEQTMEDRMKKMELDVNMLIQICLTCSNCKIKMNKVGQILWYNENSRPAHSIYCSKKCAEQNHKCSIM